VEAINPDFKKCVACAEEIRYEAKLCRYCSTIQSEQAFSISEGVAFSAGLSTSDLAFQCQRCGSTQTQNARECNSCGFANEPFGQRPIAYSKKYTTSQEKAIRNWKDRAGLVNDIVGDSNRQQPVDKSPMAIGVAAITLVVIILIISIALNQKSVGNGNHPHVGNSESNPGGHYESTCQNLIVPNVNYIEGSHTSGFDKQFVSKYVCSQTWVSN
jgi:ribosomal protein L37E